MGNSTLGPWQLPADAPSIAMAGRSPGAMLWAPAFHQSVRDDLLGRFNAVTSCANYRMLVALDAQLMSDADEGRWGLSAVTCMDHREQHVQARNGRFRRNNCLVTVSPCGPPRVWVRRDYRGYRKAYIAVLNALGLQGDALMVGYDADHLAAKSSLPNSPGAFIEIVPVLSSVNQAWGPVEAQEMGWVSEGSGHRRNMSHGRAAKALGIHPPSGRPGRDESWAGDLAAALRAAGAVGVADSHVRDWAKVFTHEAK